MSTLSDPAYGYRARYNDGDTANVRDAIVRPEQRGLVVAGLEGDELACWTWDDVHLAEPPARDRPVRLSNRSRRGARLAIEDAAVLSAVQTHARYLRRDPITRQQVLSIAGVTAILAGPIAFFLFGLPWIARPVSAFVPVAWEKSVGDSTVDIINTLFAHGRKLCGGNSGDDMLRALTRRLGASVETPYDIQVSVVDSDVVNALAAPGGRIVLFRGLIDRATSPDQVAGVLAHEMAHVVRRHPTQGMIASVGWSALLSVFTGGASLSNEAMARLAAHLATSAHSRELEAEADDGAVEMLAAAGISSAGLADFFRSLQALEKKGLNLPEYMATHPQTSKRIEAVEKHAAIGRASLSDDGWKSLKTICR